MKNVIILGASGNIAKHVIDILIKKDYINLTLFLPNKNRLRNKDVSKCKIVEGDVLNYHQLKDTIKGQAIVYVNLACWFSQHNIFFYRFFFKKDRTGRPHDQL